MEFEQVRSTLQIIASIMTIFLSLNQMYVRRRLIRTNLRTLSNTISGAINWDVVIHRFLISCYFFMSVMSILLLMVLFYPASLPRAGVLFACFFSFASFFWLKELFREMMRHF